MNIFNRKIAHNFNPDLYSIVSIFICVAISQLLHLLVKTLSLPIWLDTTGVIIATVMGGLIPGIITSVLNSVLMSVFYYGAPSVVYLVAGVMIPIVLSFCLNRGYIKNFLSLVGLFFLILISYSLVCATISTFIYGGLTNYPPVDNIFKQVILTPIVNKFMLSFSIKMFISFFDFIIASILSYVFSIILKNYTPFNFK